jgi:acyl-CoA thioester hydrolase
MEQPFQHCIELQPRFSDLDAMKHLNNATYLTYIEEGRIAYFHDIIGLQRNSMRFDAIVAKIEIEYLKPVAYGDKVKVYTRFSRLGSKSFDIQNLVVVVDEEGRDLPAARSLTKMVSFDYHAQKSMDIPPSVRAKVADYESLAS